MCGCYYYVFDKKLCSYLEEIESSITFQDIAQKEVFPGMNALVLMKEDTIIPSIRHWGFDGYNQKKIINARSETYMEKPLFSGLKRCVIVCNGFFEWKKTKRRVDRIYIQKRNNELIYLAGLCDDSHFVIVTGASYSHMKKVHSRTPLIMNEKEMEHYLKGDFFPKVDNEDLVFSLRNS